KLAVPKIGGKTTDLEVFVYRDINQNGIFDAGDSKATGHLMYIDQVAFITDAAGIMEYRRLLPGNHKITVANQNGWYAPDRILSLDKKKHRIEIGLYQTGALKGTLSYKFNELSYEISRNVQGITIVATGENNVRYMTKTNPEGQYVFYLPVGRYSLQADPSNLPPEVEVESSNRMFQLSPDHPQRVDIELKVKSR